MATRRLGTSQIGGLDFVDDQQRYRIKRQRLHIGIHGRRVEGNTQAPCVRLCQQVGELVDLVLQHQKVTAVVAVQHLVDMVPGLGAVRSGEQHDGVLAGGRHLNHGMPGGNLNPAYPGDIHASRT